MDPAPELSAAPQEIAPAVYAQNHYVRSGLLHTDGSMWFTTNHEGVYRYAEGVFTQFTESDGLPTNYVSTPTEDHTRDL